MKGCFVYFFYDQDNTLLYIGKSVNIGERMKLHFSIKNTIENPWKHSINRKSIILYQCENPTDLELYETYFINKYLPLHNRDKVYRYKSTFELPYLKPINPFDELLKNSLMILSMFSKFNEEEYQCFLKTMNLNSFYVSINDNGKIYLDKSKFGQLN